MSYITLSTKEESLGALAIPPCKIFTVTSGGGT